jgi:hypothetical protein
MERVKRGKMEWDVRCTWYDRLREGGTGQGLPVRPIDRGDTDHIGSLTKTFD